jgi:hypothetical protein
VRQPRPEDWLVVLKPDDLESISNQHDP